MDIRGYTGASPAGESSSIAFPYQVLSVSHFGKKKSSSYWMNSLEQAIAGVRCCGGAPRITAPDRPLPVGKAETDLQVVDLVGTRAITFKLLARPRNGYPI